MCNLQIVPDKLVEIIVEKGIQSLWRHLGYLFHYKKNVKNLKVEMEKLQERRSTIQGRVDEANNRGDQVILYNVSDWLNDADRLIEGVQKFMDEEIVKGNIHCFKFSCPDFILRHGLSKEAIKNMGDLESLSKEGHFDPISCQKPTPPPPPPPPPPLEIQLPSCGEYMNFDTREPVFNRIMEALQDPMVNVMGIYGIGGVGKTTMVKRVGEQVKEDKLFDEVVTAVVSQGAKVLKIQGELAAFLKLPLKGESEVDKRIQLWERFNNGKRNLVILDDVWEELNLKEIGIPIKDGNKGCKVVLTSRNRHIFKNMVVHGGFKEVYRDFSIEVLSEDEAWNLFKNKMGNNIDPHQQLYDIAHEVCGECGGLPVAILAVATALKDQPIPAWRSSLVQLKESKLNSIEGIDPKLFNSLRLSFDYLKSKNAKSCFLLCCSFPEDAQISVDELAVHCMARRLFHDQDPDTLEEARDIVCFVVNTLKTSCLLLDGKNDDFVKMHDVVRDVAILIAKEEKAYLVKHGVKKWPEKKDCEKFLAISLMSETIRELPDELVSQELQMLMLECENGEIPDRFFSGTKKLMVLELNKATMWPELPSSLGELTELRMLCLNRCKLGDIATLKYLKNTLEILRLRGSKITALPLEVGELTCLRLLDLGECDKLKVIPSGVISKLDRLEELHFPKYFNNWEATTNDEDNNSEGTTGNEEISNMSPGELKLLTRLSTLDIHGVPFFWQLPMDPCFQSLIRFDIGVGRPVRDQYDNIRYSLLRGGFCFEEECSSQGVMRIQGICSDDDFNCWKRLLGKPKWFNNLTQLVVKGCRLKYLFTPSSARELQQLQSLSIARGEIMEAVIGNVEEKDEEIIDDVINFSQLKILSLIDNPCLVSFFSRIKKATTESHLLAPAQSLFNEKVAVPSLEDLRIIHVPTIIAIWDVQTFPDPEKASDSLFSQLKDLCVSFCPGMVNVVQGFPNTEVRGTDEMKGKQVNHNYILQFPRLRCLHLAYLDRLSSFNNTSGITEARPLFNNQVAFPALEQLDIYSVPNITMIWDNNLLSTESFRLPWSLSVLRCEKLTKVWDSEKLMNLLPLLRNIKKLTVGYCPVMEAIVFLEEKEEGTQEANNKDVILFPKLTRLELLNLKNLKGICAYKSKDQLCFNIQVTFPDLRILYIKDLPLITRIWGMETFPVLAKASDSSSSQLTINDTCIITEARPLFHQGAFPALEELSVTSMQNITEIWDKNVVPTGFFGQLKKLDVEKCPKAEVIEVLEERQREPRQATNNVIIVFPKLTEMTLTRLGSLKGVCAYKTEDKLCFIVQVAFPALQKLYIESVPRITAIWGMQAPENATDSSFSQLVNNTTSATTETRPLFSHQVAFSAFKDLAIGKMPNITEIWDENVLPTGSFCQLESLEVWDCKKLMNVIPPHIPPPLNIEQLQVSNCPKMEVIVVSEERGKEAQEATNKDIIVFPKLYFLKLRELKNLKGICAYKSKDQLYFNVVQVAFPKLDIRWAFPHDEHSRKIFAEATSNKKMLDALEDKDDSEAKVGEDEDDSKDKVVEVVEDNDDSKDKIVEVVEDEDDLEDLR